MDLMTLAAKLTLDDSGFRSGLNSAESMGERFAGKMSAMTVAAGQIIANLVQKSFSAVTGMISGAVDAVADYEQLIGGVETLFKGSADTVANYAKNSFKTTGLSANAYMETVTGFSASLLQGLKGDTEEAAELANVAVTDMADNANKMGTDLSSIQTAYQGFAKQNYTMLDNLKLGYGGTKEEMVRLINDSGILNEKIEDLDGITFDQIIEAIHKIQEEMGITGTTAEEAAQTISGSKASLKAAWEDLLSAVGGEGGQARLDETLENFKTSFSTYMDNYIPALTTTIINSGTLVEAIADSLSSLPDGLISTILNAALEGGAGIVDGAGQVVNWLIEQMGTFLHDSKVDSSHVEAFGQSLGEFVGGTLRSLAENINLEDLLTFGVTLAGKILEGLWNGLFGNEAEISLSKIEEEFTNTLTETELQSAKAQGILSTMQALYDKYGAAARETDEWKRREDELEKVLGGSKETFDQYGENVQGAITHLQQMSEELRKLAIQQAMQDKLTAQYKELGEHEEAKLLAEQAIIDAQDYNKALNDQIAATAKAYASEILRNNAAEEGSEAWWTAKNTLEQEGYAGTGMDRLIDAIEMLYDRTDTKEEDTVWGKNDMDNILSPAVVQGLGNQFAANEEIIKTNTETIKQEQTAIDTVTAAIGVTERAIARAESDIAALGSAASSAAGKLAGISIPNIAKPGYTGPTFMPRAVGIDYAPYDGFRTELHRGEAIITKEENAKRREGMDQAAMETALTDAIERSMSRIYINMDGNRVGDLTTRRTQSNISGNERSRIRAMGG